MGVLGVGHVGVLGGRACGGAEGIGTWGCWG